LASLQRHPDSAGSAVRAIEAEVRRAGDEIHLEYTVQGDMQRVRIPDAAPPRRADELWKHTCFELFVAQKDSGGYVEFNFSPSGEWACYGFSSYRTKAATAGRAPEIAAQRAADRLELRARVRISTVKKLEIGISAVIEETNGALSYWALRHAPGKPDFHHRDAFALELDEVRH
jgi:hypothetical protein